MKVRGGAAVATLVMLTAITGCGGGSSKPSKSVTSDTSAKSSEKAAGEATSNGSCGTHDENGVQVRTFCGNAKATLTAGGKTVTFAKGECETTADYVSVNVGSIVLGMGDKATALKAQKTYFGLNVGKFPGSATGTKAASADGTYGDALVAANDHGAAHDASGASVTLSDNRKSGTFTGKDINGGDLSGSFSC